MKRKPQTVVQSFAGAFRGLGHAARERSFVIELIAAVLVIAVAFIAFEVPLVDRMIIVLLVGFVLSLEIFNTAIELLLDHLSPDDHGDVARIKELLAAGVLVISCAALIIAILLVLHALA